MVSIGTGEGLPDLEAGVRIAEAFAPVLATVGVHPEAAAQITEDIYLRLRELLTHPKVVAMGEVGLDYHWEPVLKPEQHRLFIRQMEIAADAGKPIVIHTRDAWEDTFDLLERYWTPTELPCVLHCFTGNPEQVRRALALGHHVSFAGIVTYPKAVEVQEAAKLVPLDRLLIETDAPYLAPAPNRGKRNEPSYVVHTAKRLAEIRGEDLATLAEATTSNFQRLFCVPQLP
jgi:TatD DNase family protein